MTHPVRMPMLRRVRRFAAVALVAAARLSAQDAPTSLPPWWQAALQQPQQQKPTPATTTLLPNPMDILLRGPDVHPRYRPSDAANPAFQGFPVIVPPGFGAYPGGQLPVPFRDEGVAAPGVPAIPRSPNAWPTWLAGSREGDKFTSDLAIVAQSTDYVWVREPDERAFEPLAWWDRFRVVRAGTEVDVRGGGQFALAFQRGGTVRVLGRARLTLETLDDEKSSLAFEDLTRVMVAAFDRPVRIRVGAAGTLEFSAARVTMSRTDGVVLCENVGPGTAVLELPNRRVEIPATHSVRIIPDSATGELGAALGLGGDVQSQRDGRVLRAQGAGAGGSVTWSGARFRLDDGAVLRLDALAGPAFPDHSDQLP